MLGSLFQLNTLVSASRNANEKSAGSTPTPISAVSSTLTSPDDSDYLTPATSTIAISSAQQSSENLSASHRSPYTSPPPVKYPYKPEQALDDIHGLGYALKLFLESHMLESEEYCHRSDEPKERLYFATGYSLIQCVKGMMSYEDHDLLAALNHARHGNNIATLHRKRQAFFGSLVSVLQSPGVSWIQGMTPVERHAELVYAESLFEKALLGIIYSGDWLAFIKEALNMRTTIAIYRQLSQYIDVMDAEAEARGEGPADKTIDEHFRTGVYLGMGMSNIVLSLMPGKLMTLVELFGYHGDRKLGLDLLLKAGGWRSDVDEPDISAADEGLRRTVCDMCLLIFHLIISSFTFDGVDIPMAQRILNWNLKRYPNGIFFLFGAGRLALVRSQPQRAIEYYTKAMQSQAQYKNLDHISYWEIAIANLSLWNLPASLKCWKELEAEATWSKAIYSYGLAVCLWETAKTEDERAEAAKLMKKVPDLRQRIAGKSIPLEKFVARKARKFETQRNRLTLAGLEVAYIFHAIAHSPRSIIVDSMLPEITDVLHKLDEYRGKVEKYENGKGYWDDLCLARFLQGVCLRYVAYPDQEAEVDPGEVVSLAKEDAEAGAVEVFRQVFEHGPNIELDHHLVYHAHYEFGRLLACQGKLPEAREQFELVLSGRYLEVGPSGKKGKYSLENALHMRTHAANDALYGKRRL